MQSHYLLCNLQLSGRDQAWMFWRHQKFTLHHEGRYLIATSIHCKIDSFLELEPVKSIKNFNSRLRFQLSKMHKVSFLTILNCQVFYRLQSSWKLIYFLKLEKVSVAYKSFADFCFLKSIFNAKSYSQLLSLKYSSLVIFDRL